MTRLLIFLLLLCLLPATLSFPERGIPVGTLDEDVLFEISWPGKTKATEIAGLGESRTEARLSEDAGGSEEQLQEEPQEGSQEEGAVLVEKLPNTLLLSGGEEPSTSAGSVVMTTADHERYRCVLPELTEGTSVDEEEEDAALLPEVLLAPLMVECTTLGMGYWTYELCHGQYLRQYHEDKNAPEGKKLTEYYLGDGAGASAPPTPAEGELGGGGADGKVETGGQKSEKEVPVWHFNGQDYPYYEVEMSGGTPCDLLNSDPRSTRIMYICERGAHPTGSFLHIEEVTTCKYSAVVATSQLCQNEAYTLKESPVHTIQCYAEKDAPKRPRILLEHELVTSMLQAKQSSQKPVDSPPLKGAKEGTHQQQQHSAAIDTRYVESFLSGDMCLRGGSGWWQHEICFKQYVKQLHLESNKMKVEVLLGSWDEAAHKEWFSKAGKKKQSQIHVTHMYTGGDRCDLTGVARTCQVHFKCLMKSTPSQISLYLEEPTPCTYILTVEGSFICPLLETVDEFGIFHFPLQDSQVSDTDESMDRDSDMDSSDESSD